MPPLLSPHWWLPQINAHETKAEMKCSVSSHLPCPVGPRYLFFVHCEGAFPRVTRCLCLSHQAWMQWA